VFQMEEIEFGRVHCASCENVNEFETNRLSLSSHFDGGKNACLRCKTMVALKT
jgi:hypothetical protein